MTDFDRQLDAAVTAEERDLLRRIGEEPGAIPQMIGLFRGRMGWVHLVMMLAQSALFIAGVWAAWRFVQATDALEALRWGLPAAVAVLAALVIKVAMYPVLHIRQLRLELLRLHPGRRRGRRPRAQRMPSSGRLRSAHPPCAQALGDEES